MDSFERYTIPQLNWTELNGKKLKIFVSEAKDGTTVVGLDEESDIIYLLHQKIVEERPPIFTAPLKNPNLFKKVCWE
nr:hypothetical protein [Fredinandcohnia onubensis]